jgi:sigma-E factor negative regulatory protein RseA
VDQNQDKLQETRLNEARLHEAMSALMDGEADELELRRILRELPAKPELYAAWKRYHSVRASLQQDIHHDPAVNLLQGVQARLAAEGFEHQAKFGPMLRSRVVRYLGQGAIAASVAFAALMGVSVLDTADTGTPSAQTVADASSTPELSRTAAIDADAYNRLEQAVYRGFSDLSSPEQIPVSYNPEFPVDTTPAE